MVYISKVINTILTLTDKMTAPLKNTSKAVKKSQETLDKLKATQSKYKVEVNKATRKVEDQTEKIQELIQVHGEDSQEVKKAREQLEKYTEILKEAKKASSEAAKATSEHAASHKKLKNNVAANKTAMANFTSSMDKAIVKTAKITAGLAVSAGSLALGVGFSEAFDMEGYKMQLLTATKDTQKASKAMVAAVKFANSTPFETGEVVGATAKMEAYGISSEKWLKDVADMAGATNKSIDQATEAMADAVMGEYERMKEFGIKKSDIITRAEALSSKAIVVGKKGEAAKRAAIEKALQQIMREKFEGGAEAMANTFKGKWSTITGVAKSALAKIVGMNEDGTIRVGSMYEKLKEQMQKVIDVLNKAMADGTVEKIAEQVTMAVTSMIEKITEIISFVSKYRNEITFLVKTLGTFIGVVYTINKALQVYNAIMTVSAAITAFVSGPIGLIALAIAGVVMAAHKLGILDDILKVIAGAAKVTWGVISAIPKGIKEEVTKALSWITDKMNAFSEKWKKFKSFFGFGDEEVKMETVVNKKAENKIITTSVPNITPANTGVLPAYQPQMESNSSSFVIQPKAKKHTEKVIEKTIVEKQSTPNITVTITGDVYGFEDFKEKVAEAIIKIQNINKSNVVA